MDISKLNKLNLCLLFVLFFYSCGNFDKNNIEATKKCYEETNIHFKQSQEKMRISFVGRFKDISLDNMYIKIISNGKEKEVNFQKLKDYSSNSIQINQLINLQSTDSINIIFNKGDNIVLHNFRNVPHFGGKKNLGCYFGYCMVKNDTISTINGHIYIK